jgi:hypothetical protein
MHLNAAKNDGKNESARYTYARARLRTARMARGKKALRAAQKRQCEQISSTEQQSNDEAQAQKSEPKRPRKARDIRKQLFRKERVRAQNRLTKECAAQTCTSDDEVSVVDDSPGADMHMVFGAREREHEEYVNVSVEDDDGWQQQRPSRKRVYDTCAWADACLENVCEARESGESCSSDAEMPETDFLAD